MGVFGISEAAEVADLVDLAVLIDVADLTVRSDAADGVEAILVIVDRVGMELEYCEVVNRSLILCRDTGAEATLMWGLNWLTVPR